MSLSSIEAEFIAAGACCAQILYIEQMILDYGLELGSVPLLCDNQSAIKIGKILSNIHALRTWMSIIIS